MRLLAVGDIVGKPGRRILETRLREIVRGHSIDFVIVNCENAAGGFGITPEIAGEFFDLGIGCLTSGNHIWKHRSIYEYIEQEPRLLRPANFPLGTPGRGHGVFALGAGASRGLVAVMNLQGLAGLDPLANPFEVFEELLQEVREATPVIVVDFHAESTAEKAGLAHMADGRISLLFGTHTHVQTADERILPGGTAFLTDVGMTGPEDSVIGVAKDKVIERFVTRMPVRFEVPDGAAMLCAVVVEVDDSTGRARQVYRLQVREDGRGLEAG